jgi:hypothetical protein
MILLIFTTLTTILLSYGCAQPTNEQAVETESEEESETQASETGIAENNEDLHGNTATATTNASATTQNQSEIPSCILGYWKVEPESLRYAANSLITIPNLYITGLGPSVVFSFYYVGNEPTAASPYRMDVWYTDVLINSNIQSSGQSNNNHTIDLHIDGVYASDLYPQGPGGLYYIPIPDETQIQVTDVWLDGEPLTDSPIDISDWADPDHGKETLYECLGNGRLSLTDLTSGTPIYLNSVPPLTRVSN